MKAYKLSVNMKTLRNSLALLSAFALAFASQPIQAADSRPKVGDKAPVIHGVDQDGNKWKMSQDLGSKLILLYFYPKDDTPGCTKEACGLRDRMGDLKSQAVDVVGVSFDSVESHKKFAFKYDLNFTLLADTDGKIADAYHVRMGPARKMDSRVSFLIGVDGKILHVTDSPSADVHLEEMQRAIRTAGSQIAK
jgi:thioredoxin-dependent peroxiredoxin